jgi:hypothetical protein
MRQLGAPAPDLRVHQVADPMLTSTDDDVSIIPRFVDVTATQGRREAMPVDATSREGGLKEQIRERYAERAREVAAHKPTTCGCGCSSGGAVVANDELARGLYEVDETGALPPRPCWPAWAAATPRRWPS